MKTIAQQLNIQEFPFEIKNKNGNIIYYENSNGYWRKREFNTNGNRIYFENSRGYWIKREYDTNGNQIYYEDSNGEIVDNRSKKVELTMNEIAKKFDIPVSQLKIKK